MMNKIKTFWLSYCLYAARKNAKIEEYAAVAASQNARYFHLRAIQLESEINKS